MLKTKEQNYIFNMVMFWKGYDIKKHLKLIEDLKTHSFDKSIEWMQEKKWDIARFHFSNNSFYKNKIGTALPDNWNDIPKITKSELQVDMKDIITKNIKKNNIYISNTSGSSGHPFYFAKDKNAHARAWAYWTFRYSEIGLSLKSKEARFYGIPKEIKSFLIEKIKDRLLNRVRFPVFDLSDNILDDYLTKFRNIKFDYIYGYTNSILLFAKYLRKKDVILKSICPTLKIIIVTSEVCTKNDRAIIEKHIGVPLKNEYGASEIGYIAYECDSTKWHVCKENIYLEQEDDGNLLITDLYNKAYPMIKYEIGDIGNVEYTICDCGVKDILITNFDGRKNDNIILPSGLRSPGLTFYYISRSILESKGFIKEFIVRQISINTFIFEFVSEKDLDDNIHESLKILMAKYLEPGLKLKIKKVNSIKRPKSGKIQHFYSEINTKDIMEDEGDRK